MPRKSEIITKPLVCIWMCTYNQSEYISQAIDSIFNQKTSFPIKLIISDDGSADGTREICLEAQNNCPEIIDLILAPENTKCKVIIDQLYPACFQSGAKYLAICEGDDYWTDPYKLQKQVDFLDTNPEYYLCQHRSKLVWDDGSRPSFILPCDKEELTTLDILQRNLYSKSLGPVPRTHTSSSVFRMNLFRRGLPPKFERVFAGDRYLYLWALLHGKLKVLYDAMSVYRQHNYGLSKGGGHADLILFTCDHEMQDFQIYKELLPKKYHAEIDTILKGIGEIADRRKQFWEDLEKCVYLWKEIPQKYHKIGLFGAGEHTVKLLEYLSASGLRMPVVIFDSNPKVEEIFGISVRSVRAMNEYVVDLVALSTMQFQKEMREQVVQRLGEFPILDFYATDPLGKL